jgi:hypothetical protein
MRALRSRIVLPSADVGDLLFGQQHIFTQEYFASRNPAYHTVPVYETPHFHALLASDGEADYLDYLERSWEYYRPYSNVPSEREARLRRFHGLLEAVRSAGGILEPVRIFRRPDGGKVILDGNHRAAIALALGLDLPAIDVPASDALRSIAKQQGASRWFDVPGESVFHAGKEVVRGLRSDIWQRIERLDPSRLSGASVLDVGCGFGASSYVAAEMGAASVHGVEQNRRSASAAVRLNSFFTAPCHFSLHDFSKPFFSEKPYDVVLCFALGKRLSMNRQLAETLRACTRGVLYLEGEVGISLSHYRAILGIDRFSEASLVGYGKSGGRMSVATRPLYRCVV